jgi:molybdate transport system regulatory protein
MVKLRHPETIGLRIRVVLGDGLIMGPGRADLLQGIRETGSIAAAGRRMGMSYKRAWQLAETLNSTFHAPVIVATKGGVAGGGAHLSSLGDQVLDAYRALAAAAHNAGETAITALAAAVAGP